MSFNGPYVQYDGRLWRVDDGASDDERSRVSLWGDHDEALACPDCGGETFTYTQQVIGGRWYVACCDTLLPVEGN